MSPNMRHTEPTHAGAKCLIPLGIASARVTDDESPRIVPAESLAFSAPSRRPQTQPGCRHISGGREGSSPFPHHFARRLGCHARKARARVFSAARCPGALPPLTLELIGQRGGAAGRFPSPAPMS